MTTRASKAFGGFHVTPSGALHVADGVSPGAGTHLQLPANTFVDVTPSAAGLYAVQAEGNVWLKKTTQAVRRSFRVVSENWDRSYPDSDNTNWVSYSLVATDLSSAPGLSFGANSFTLRFVGTIDGAPDVNDLYGLFWCGKSSGAPSIAFEITTDANGDPENIRLTLQSDDGTDLIDSSDSEVDVSSFISKGDGTIYDIFAVIERDGSDIDIMYYVNGVPVGATGVVSADTDTLDIQTVTSGGRINFFNGFNHRFEGDAYCFETYTEALTQTQVQERTRAGYYINDLGDNTWPSVKLMFDNYQSWSVATEPALLTGFSAANPDGTETDSCVIGGINAGTTDDISEYSGYDFAGYLDSFKLLGGQPNPGVLIGEGEKVNMMSPTQQPVVLVKL